MGRRTGAGIVTLLALAAGAWFLVRSHASSERAAAPLSRSEEESPEAPTLRGAEPPAIPEAVPTEAPHGPAGSPPAAAPATPVRYVVRGRVLDRVTRRGLAGAELRASRGTDPRVLRFSHPELRTTRTDEEGHYELVFELATVPAELVFTALAPGYQSPHALPAEMDGEVYMEQTRLRVVEAAEQELDLSLLPGLDVAGVATDEEGTPVAGAVVVVTLETPSSTQYVELLETDALGRFRIYDLPSERPTGGEQAAAMLSFTEPTHVEAAIEDVYALTREERSALEVVLRRGLTLAGVLQHADGTPAAGHLVETFLGDPNDNRKGAWTDEAGRFEIEGLAAGELVLRAASAASLGFVRQDLRLLRSESGLVLRLEPLPLLSSVPRQHILGLEVVVLPPEVREMLDYPESYALWITGISDDAPEGLREHARVGDVLWNVGTGRDLSSVRDVVQGVLASVDRLAGWDEQAGRPPRETYGVRLVIGIRRPDLAGTNTQGMRVTRGEVEALRQWLAEHPAED